MNNRLQMRLIKSCQTPHLYKEEVQRWHMVLYFAVAFFIVVGIFLISASLFLNNSIVSSSDSFVFWLCEVSLVVLVILLAIKIIILNRELYL